MREVTHEQPTDQLGLIRHTASSTGSIGKTGSAVRTWAHVHFAAAKSKRTCIGWELPNQSYAAMKKDREQQRMVAD